MDKVMLSKTELKVSRIGFGGLPIQAVERDSAGAALNTPLTSVELESLAEDKKEPGSVFCRFRCDYCMPCSSGIQASMIVRAGLFFKRVGWDKMEQKDVEMFANSENRYYLRSFLHAG